ncbi:MAG: type I methionyl aminopeptidase [Phycisphaerales bacterium]|nr:type I methionyl aminopeptidase [Planctomycetota bacterium]
MTGKLSPADVDGAYAAAQKVVEVHRKVVEFVRPGVTLAQIDQLVARTLESQGAASCFLGYRQSLRGPKFPSHACLSVNDCIVHGTAASLSRPLAAGDLLKVDVGVSYRGWIGDAAWTYSLGKPDSQIRRLMDAGKRSLREGIDQLRPGRKLMDWARTVQKVVEQEAGFFLIQGLGGHGYGRKLHDSPYVSNSVPLHHGEWPDGGRPCMPGMLLALEPMIGVGTGRQRSSNGNDWPVYTADGSMASHHEHDVLITEGGPRVLTEGLDELSDELPV